MKPSHRRTAVLAALLAAWILLVPLGGGIHRAAAIADSAKAVNGSRNIQITGKKAGNTSIKVTFSNGSYKTTEVKVAKGSAKLRRATVKLYPGARHELLNEINRQEVFSDLLAWLEGHLEP